MSKRKNIIIEDLDDGFYHLIEEPKKGIGCGSILIGIIFLLMIFLGGESDSEDASKQPVIKRQTEERKQSHDAINNEATADIFSDAPPVEHRIDLDEDIKVNEEMDADDIIEQKELNVLLEVEDELPSQDYFL